MVAFDNLHQSETRERGRGEDGWKELRNEGQRRKKGEWRKKGWRGKKGWRNEGERGRVCLLHLAIKKRTKRARRETGRGEAG